MKLSLAAALFACALAAGCSTTMEPKLPPQAPEGFDLVDKTKVDPAQYQKDYTECSALANQDPSDMGRMAAGALGGVAEKASFGIIGNKASKHADRVTVLKRCLSGRGYTILR